MFVPSEPISEVIAHFIGYFNIHLEEMRTRIAYDDFAFRSAAPGTPDLPYEPTVFRPHLQLRDYDPHVRYTPPDPEGELQLRSSDLPPPHLVQFHASVPGLHVQGHHAVFGLPVADDIRPMMAPPAGSTVLAVQQILMLSDDDIVISGDIVVNTARALGDGGALDIMLGLAQQTAGPLAALNAPHAIAPIAPYFADAHAAIHAIAAAQGSDGTVLTVTHDSYTQSGFHAEVTTVTGPAISGVYVDGVQQDAPPQLSDFLPAHLQDQSGGIAIELPTATTQQATLPIDDAAGAGAGADAPAGSLSDANVTIDPSSMGTSMTVNAGGNLLLNEVSLFNAGVTSTFVAVGGDYHAINAIIQTNIFSDHDLIDPRFPGAGNPGSEAGTAAHNVASFTAQAMDNGAAQQALNPGVFPTNWTVSLVHGDLAFVDWVKQYSFSSDSDTHVLTATGTTTTITTGENIGINGVSFADIGKYFDVILVQGSFYNGNIITQTNVLYDNDVVTWLNGSGPPAGDTGSVSTSGNLLWNSASITTIGMTDIQSGLPSPYADAMNQLGNSHYDMPSSLGSYSQFEGFANLRVLYVAGNLYDLHTISQVNVLGDADLVAAYHQNVLAGSQPDQWAISTGSNVLANVATITDYSSVGTSAHIGGSIYTDALLIQANLVDASAPNGPAQGQLANEVIAFLDIDASSIAPDHHGPAMSLSDLPTADPLHSMLA